VLGFLALLVALGVHGGWFL